jgi:hypothetical protein
VTTEQAKPLPGSIRFKEWFGAIGVNPTGVYRIEGEYPWTGIEVWWYPTRQRACCTACHGPVAAMSASCDHARRVRRYALKNPPPEPTA